jgi:glycosyltransferase involved in cell wall biosynthesis
MPGCRDSVDDGVTGLICAPRSADAVVEAMQRMLDMPAEERLRMGSAARAKMEREFAQEIVHRAYLSALAGLGIRGAQG